MEDIIKATNVSRDTIFNVKCYPRDWGHVNRLPGSGKMPTVLTKRILNLVRSRVARNPIRSMRAMARETNVSEATVRRAVKKLGARSLARCKKFLLTERLRTLRLERVKRILWQLKKKMPILLFSDKKYFTVDPVTKSKSCPGL